MNFNPNKPTVSETNSQTSIWKDINKPNRAIILCDEESHVAAVKQAQSMYPVIGCSFLEELAGNPESQASSIFYLHAGNGIHKDEITSTFAGRPEMVVEWVIPEDVIFNGDLRGAIIELGINSAKKVQTLLADASSWPALPAKHEEAIEPFPLDIFPKKLQVFIETAAEAISCPIDFVAASVLSAISTAIGGKRKLQIKDGWQVSPVLWIGLIGETGEGKSPAMEAALAPLRKRAKENAERYKLALAQYEDDRQAAKKDHTLETPKAPVRESLVVNNTTLEALRLAVERSTAGVLLASDELAGWLRSMSAYSQGPDRQCWLSLWSSLDEESHRKTSGVTYLENPIVNLIGGIQPDIISCLHGGIDDGLLARFLLVKPAKVLGEFTLKGIPPEEVQFYEKFIESLLNLEPESRNGSGKVTPRILNLSEDALELLQVYSNGLKVDNFTDEVPTILKGTWSKADGYAGRIALSLHEAEKALEAEFSIEVSQGTMGKAIKAMNYFLNTASRLAPGFNEGYSKEEMVKQSILSWINRRKEILKKNQARFNWKVIRHALRESKGIRNSSGKVDDIRLEEALFSLCAEGYLKKVDLFDKAGKALRPDYLIHPRLLD